LSVIDGGVPRVSLLVDRGGVVLDGRYELGAVLGVGGMAQVHRGYDRLLDRPVAVKVFHRHLLDDPITVARVRSEIRVLARLDHPHLVRLDDAVFPAASAADGGGLRSPYLVMELVDGPTLAEEVRGRAMEPARAAAIGAGLAEALAHVHAAGVVHRDVKPANVLLTGEGTAKLADFGIALLGEDPRHTTTGMLVGTAGYLAPEQIRGGTVTGATDVHALGLVVLECLTGVREYPGTGIAAAVARLHRTPEVPAVFGGSWVELLGAMTEEDPSQRPSAAQAAMALHALSVDAPTRVLPLVRTAGAGVGAGVARTRSVGAGAVGVGRRRWAAPVAAAVVLLGGLEAVTALAGVGAPVVATTERTQPTQVGVPGVSGAGSSSPTVGVVGVPAVQGAAGGEGSAAATAAPAPRTVDVVVPAPVAPLTITTPAGGGDAHGTKAGEVKGGGDGKGDGSGGGD
jgi:tRNA A-37 threonylcarbamoyl transferase component Bud32